jgi:glycosyltransferase involved in cell wall biosynthesis
MTISLCTFVKNEAEALPYMIDSVQDYVSEIIIVDTGSTDNTIEVAKRFTNRIYQVGFTDFGKIRTLTSHLASQDWVLMLDADERLSNPEHLDDLVRQSMTAAYAFPRRRWLDLQMVNQTEVEAYPDWQVRLYRNIKSFTWKRELHEYFDGTAVFNYKDGPIIEHFHDVFKTPEKLQERKQQYERLAKIAGVTVEGGHPC